MFSTGEGLLLTVFHDYGRPSSLVKHRIVSAIGIYLNHGHTSENLCPIIADSKLNVSRYYSRLFAELLCQLEKKPRKGLLAAGNLSLLLVVPFSQLA